jgi:hypothetical protein
MGLWLGRTRPPRPQPQPVLLRITLLPPPVKPPLLLRKRLAKQGSPGIRPVKPTRMPNKLTAT